MKYYFLAGVVVFSGVVAVVLSLKDGSGANQADHFAAKKQIVEAETKVRPAYFEAMKFNLEAGVEQRAPASVQNSAKKPAKK